MTSDDYSRLLITAVDAELLERVHEALCPYPALRVADAWHFTRDGSLLANCQWSLLKDEALSFDEAAAFLGVKPTAIRSMNLRGKIRVYRYPDDILDGRSISSRSGWPESAWYVLRGDVEALKRE